MLNFRNYRTRKLIYEPRAFSARKRWSSLLFPRVTSRRCCNPGNDVTPRVESRCTRASFGMDTRVGWVCLGWDWEYVIVLMVIDMNALIDLNNYLRLICVWYLVKCHFFHSLPNYNSSVIKTNWKLIYSLHSCIRNYYYYFDFILVYIFGRMDGYGIYQYTFIIRESSSFVIWNSAWPRLDVSTAHRRIKKLNNSHLNCLQRNYLSVRNACNPPLLTGNKKLQILFKQDETRKRRTILVHRVTPGQEEEESRIPWTRGSHANRACISTDLPVVYRGFT